jgi:hypothetical protein
MKKPQKRRQSTERKPRPAVYGAQQIRGYVPQRRGEILIDGTRASRSRRHGAVVRTTVVNDL